MENKKAKRISYKKKYLEIKEKLENLKKELASTDEEAKEYLDYLKRLKAEFENYKKRVLKEREEVRKLANENLIRQFLPIMDDLERAINSAKETRSINSLIEGIVMILNQLKEILKKQGVEEIEAKGREFDPYLHEAVLELRSDEYPDNFVVEEMRKGYKLNNRILRPAMVKVNKRNPK